MPAPAVLTPEPSRYTPLMPTARLVLASVCSISVAAAAASLGALQTTPPADIPPSYPGYSLVWADEFNRAGEPDPTRWTYEHGFVRNQELQWYQPQNARQADGLLVIEARRERVANPRYEAGAGDWRATASLRSTPRRAS